MKTLDFPRIWNNESEHSKIETSQNHKYIYLTKCLILFLS